jgi:hypothetical protein
MTTKGPMSIYFVVFFRTLKGTSHKYNGTCTLAPLSRMGTFFSRS